MSCRHPITRQSFVTVFVQQQRLLLPPDLTASVLELMYGHAVSVLVPFYNQRPNSSVSATVVRYSLLAKVILKTHKLSHLKEAKCICRHKSKDRKTPIALRVKERDCLCAPPPPHTLFSVNLSSGIFGHFLQARRHARGITPWPSECLGVPVIVKDNRLQWPAR